jgi:hypothetical protein
MAKYYYGKHHNAPSLCDARNDDITHTLPHYKMYVISYHETNHTNGWHTRSGTAHLTGMNPSTQIHPVTLFWLADNWEIEIGSDRDSIKCYTEMKVKDGLTYRAHPNYCNEGPWQDWANSHIIRARWARCVPNGSIQNIVILYPSLCWWQWRAERWNLSSCADMQLPSG